MSFTNRAAGALSRRLDRPELLALFSSGARTAQRDEVAITAILASSLRGGGYVDVGANRGQILADAVRIAPAAHHVAFEPIPALAQQLASAFPSVDCRQKALGARPERTEFCYFHRLDGWSGLRRNPEISDERGEPEYISVEVSTLDTELAGEQPTVLKIDVEGAELAVLEGARQTLAQTRPVLILEHVREVATLYGAASEAIWDLLSEQRYEIFTATGEGPYERPRFAAAGGVVNWLAAPLR